MMAKDMVWHELYDRMEGNRCPVCELILQRTKSFMGSILYEGVNDSSVREKIKSSYGLCNYHASMLMNSGDPLAHALIYHDLIHQAIYHMNLGKYNEEALTHSRCIFCEQAILSEKQYLQSFADTFLDAAFRKRYEDAGMLCYPHLVLLSSLKGIRANVLEGIKKPTKQKYESMLKDLEEIQQRNDYRFSQEPWTEELKISWKKAVFITNDKTGIRK